jgi:hypothetical protein
MGQEVYGRAAARHGRSPIEWVNGIEKHKSGWPHSHALLRLPGVELKDRAQFNLAEWQKWITGTGGFAWLTAPRNQGDVVSYVTKYVVKDGDLAVSANLSPSVDPYPALLHH